MSSPLQGIRQPAIGPGVVLGVALLVLSLSMFLSVGPVGGVLLLGAAGVLWAVLSTGRRGDVLAIQGLRASFDAIQRGRLDEAAEELGRIAERPQPAWLLRVADIQRGIIEVRRGRLERALAHLDAALARPLDRRSKNDAAYQIEGALALRAFVLASLGRKESALSDVALVRANPGATNEALARVALAELLVAERSGDRDRARALLAQHKTLLLEGCHPRERGMVRALQRMLKAGQTSVYRKSAERISDDAPAGGEPSLADWVAKVAPTVAPFVRAPRRGRAAGSASEPISSRGSDSWRFAAAVRARQPAAVAGSARRGSPVLQGFAWLAGMFALSVAVIAAVALSRSVGGLGGSPQLAAGVGWLGTWVVLGLFIGAGGVALSAQAMIRRARDRRSEERDLSALTTAGRLLASGRLDEAGGVLDTLRASRADLVAAQARLLSAMLDERRGRFQEMLAHCDEGLARLHAVGPAEHAAPMLRPELAAQRAYALALLDRGPEAEAEMASLEGRGYPYQGRAAFRVRLVRLVRAGRLREAARWADEHAADLPLGVREELLADVARAAAAPDDAGAGEIERLREERRDPEQGRWLQAVSARLVEAFVAACEGDPNEHAHRVRVQDQAPVPARAAPPPARAEAEAFALAELAAEEEAVVAGPAPAARVTRR